MTDGRALFHFWKTLYEWPNSCQEVVISETENRQPAQLNNSKQKSSSNRNAVFTQLAKRKCMATERNQKKNKSWQLDNNHWKTVATQ